MSVTIRKETAQDHRKVEEVTREAFWNLYVPGASEHYLVHQLRKHPDFVSELAFVIEVDNEVIGSIFYTTCDIVDEVGKKSQAISFGPVSILPKYHRKGYGRQLIEHSLAVAKSLGYTRVMIAGYPYHYTTYGFKGSKHYHISAEDGKYYVGVMALPLVVDAFDGVSGKVYFSEALYPDEVGLEAYDATFEPKEKKVLPSQVEFEETVSKEDI